MTNENEEITLEEAAERLGISLVMVEHRIDTGRLRVAIVGGVRRVTVRDVMKLKEFEQRRRRFAADLSADTDDLVIEGRSPADHGLPDACRKFDRARKKLSKSTHDAPGLEGATDDEIAEYSVEIQRRRE